MHAQVTIMTLGEWLAEQISARGMSDREFALYVGVSNATISRAMSKDAPEPSLEFLVKLSKATGTSLIMLLQLAYPELIKVEADAGARILAEQIANLPPERREIAEAFVLGVLLKPTNEKG